MAWFASRHLVCLLDGRLKISTDKRAVEIVLVADRNVTNQLASAG
jgi:hypothetical protein